jgi:hypothetical protein
MRVGSLTDAARSWSAHYQLMPSSLFARVLVRLRGRRAKSLNDLSVADHRRIESHMRETLEQLTERRDG